MWKVFLFSAVLMLWGCAGTPEKEPLVLVAEQEILTIRVSPARDAFEIEATLSRDASGNSFDLGELEYGALSDVITAPKITAKLGEWNEIHVTHRIRGFEPQVACLIDGEMVTAGAHAGVSLKVMATALENNRARVKGVLVLSKFNQQRELGTRTFPFDAEFSLNEWTIVYQRRVKVDAPPPSR